MKVGLGGVILASLYKPLNEKNMKKVSGIITATNKFYKRISIIFIIYTLILAILYPILVRTNFSFMYISILTLILSINLFSQYCFSLTWKTMLKADNKIYYVSFVQILCIIINTIGVAITIKIWPNIHIVKLFTAIIYFIQPILFQYYINKKYDVNIKEKPDEKALSQRWNGFGINIAAFIHNNTDVIILTLFTNLKNVSIYSVYYLVTTGLKNIIMSISAGMVPSLGHIYVSENKEQLNSAFDLYEFIIYFCTFLLFTLGAILITPFIMVYTKGINDTNYYQPIFGIIMIMSEFMYCIREPYVSIAYNANKFKEVSKYAYIEAIINIILSIILVIKFELIGVAMATFIAMLYRTVSHIIYLKNNILHRKIIKAIKKFSIFTIATIIIIILSNMMCTFNEITVRGWIIYV